MAVKLKQMYRSELMRKLSKGERDIRKIRLMGDSNLSDHPDFKRLNDFLSTQDFLNNPIDISNSEFEGLKARGISLPHVIAIGNKFTRANFAGADFYMANFAGADLTKADFRYVKNLEYTLNLNYQSFFRTRIKEEQRGAIERQLSEQGKLFVVE